jgi:beta-galactosidase
LPYGTDRNIVGTENDPIYQTQQTAIQQYRFDVPEGNYELALHFAELQGGIVSVPPLQPG